MMGKQQINELFVNNTQYTVNNISGIGRSRISGMNQVHKITKIVKWTCFDGKSRYVVMGSRFR